MYINHTFKNDVTHLFKYILLNIYVMVQFAVTLAENIEVLT